MQITDIKITPVQNDKLKAYVSVVFDTCFVVHDIKIIKTFKGLYVCMPSKRSQIDCPVCKQKIPGGSMFCQMCGASVPVSIGSSVQQHNKNEFRDIAHPITTEFRKTISDAVMNKYENKN